jgi:hypothetical protein
VARYKLAKKSKYTPKFSAATKRFLKEWSCIKYPKCGCKTSCARTNK